MRERIDTTLTFHHNNFIRYMHAYIEAMEPDNDLLKCITLECDEIHANPNLFEKYGRNLKEAIDSYIMELNKATTA